jgi:hypothetical protein
MAFTSGQMELSTKAILRMTYLMDTAYSSGQMELSSKAIMRMA